MTLITPACEQPEMITKPRSRTLTTSAWSSQIIGSGRQSLPSRASWIGKPVSNSVTRSTCPETRTGHRSEEHTSELQSRGHLVCRLLLEKKKKNIKNTEIDTELPD